MCRVAHAWCVPTVCCRLVCSELLLSESSCGCVKGRCARKEGWQRERGLPVRYVTMHLIWQARCCVATREPRKRAWVDVAYT